MRQEIDVSNDIIDFLKFCACALNRGYKMIKHCDKTAKTTVLAVLSKAARTKSCDFVACNCFRLISVVPCMHKNIFEAKSCRQ